MENKKYITGIILDNNKSVGVSLYDMKKKEVEIRSMQSVINDFLLGDKIVGIKNKKQTVYLMGRDICEVREYPQLSKTYYDTRKLPIIDCEGNLITKGSDVCIGTLGIGESKKYIVINNKGNVRLLSNEEVKREKIVGIIQGDKRIDVIRDCKNIYMTMEEFEGR